MAVTIKDVAKKAGVAHGTVSRYLNGYTLSEENKIKVENAIKELDYKINFMARGLKNNKSHIVGVVVRSLVDFFHTSIVTYIEDVLEKNGYGIIICDYSDNSTRLESKLRFLMDRSVDGIIVFPNAESLPVYEELRASKIPVVLIDDDVLDYHTDKVFVDNSVAAFKATERLISLGHNRIAIISKFSKSVVAQERIYGYLDALRKYNIPIIHEYLVDGSLSIKFGYTAAKQLINLKNPPTAIFIANYYTALGAVSAIQEENLKIPQDISIISFDYFKQYDSVNMPLTCIVQPVEEIGKEAAMVLIKRMNGDFSDFPTKKVLETTMLLRNSEAKI